MSRGSVQPAVVTQPGPQTIVPNPVYQKAEVLPAVVTMTGTQTITPGPAR